MITIVAMLSPKVPLGINLFLVALFGVWDFVDGPGLRATWNGKEPEVYSTATFQVFDKFYISLALMQSVALALAMTLDYANQRKFVVGLVIPYALSCLWHIPAMKAAFDTDGYFHMAEAAILIGTSVMALMGSAPKRSKAH